MQKNWIPLVNLSAIILCTALEWCRTGEINKISIQLPVFIFIVYWNTHETAKFTCYLVCFLKYKYSISKNFVKIFLVISKYIWFNNFFKTYLHGPLHARWHKRQSHSPSTKSDPLLLLFKFLFKLLLSLKLLDVVSRLIVFACTC